MIGADQHPNILLLSEKDELSSRLLVWQPVNITIKSKSMEEMTAMGSPSAALSSVSRSLFVIPYLQRAVTETLSPLQLSLISPDAAQRLDGRPTER